MQTRSTKGALLPAACDALDDLAEQLNSWRSTRRPGDRIPELIWKAAASLARLQGLSSTATALKLNYYDLQRRLGLRRKSKPTPSLPTFVEMPGPPPTDPRTVELIGPNGG
ncbi:MAG: hypothetical protein HY299_13270 [Verrucomicrobia bacterium]|nr:hypothetical protein [Verrucomicrobiota bacterium]